MGEHTGQLEDLRVKSVGLVGKAANKWEFLLFKGRKKETVMAKEIAKDAPEVTEAAPVEDPVTDSEAPTAKWTDRVTAVVNTVLGKAASVAAIDDEPATEDEPVADAEPVADEEPVQDLTAVLKAQAELTVRLEKAEAELAKAKSDAAEAVALQKTATYLEKAQAWAIPGKPEDIADLLCKADYAGLSEPLVAALDAASALIAKSGVFVEKGTQAGTGESDFMGRVSARAAELRKSDASLGEHEALTKALKEVGKENPDLANDHIANRQGETGGRS